jgi:hypothetical protein
MSRGDALCCFTERSASANLADRFGALTNWSETPEAFDRVAKAVAAYFEERNPRGGMVTNERRD